MKTETAADAWSLEVVRGPDAGRRYALGTGVVVLGNALNGEPGIDLSDQETTSPRKMAGKQARLDVSNGSLTLRDMDSPGGTFVNRQRVRSGEGRPLQVGDLIQLGGVQLRVTRGAGVAASEAPRPAPPRPQVTTSPTTSPFLFTLKSGATCRSWDDFLAVSAQRWGELRDELTSGRLGAFLASIGRSDLVPDAYALGSADERLDSWIGRLPTARPAQPELDVHPRTLVLRVPAGGGALRRKLQISNAGYRLLRTTARIEPADATWLKLAPEFAGKTIDTVESSELTIEADLPESLATPRSATLILQSNGGTVSVAVRAEPGGPKADEPGPMGAAPRRESLRLRERIARQAPVVRLIAWPALAFGVRVLIAVLDRVYPSQVGVPGLAGPAMGLGILGAVLAILLAIRGRSELRDLPSSAIAGAILGAMLAALAVAACRTLEPPIASMLGTSWAVAALTWAAFAAGMAGLSIVIAPPKAAKEVTT